MKTYFIGILFFFYFCSVLGQGGKTFVYKVKAPPIKYEIVCKDSDFLLEKDTYLKVKYDEKNPKPEVSVVGAKILSEKDGVYKLRFANTGDAIFSVFRNINGKQKLVAVKRMEIKPPLLYFCGIALDSSSKILRLGKCHIWAYSEHYKAKLPINKFSMLFFEDNIITKKNKKPIADTLKADTCKLTSSMLVHLRKF